MSHSLGEYRSLMVALRASQRVSWTGRLAALALLTTALSACSTPDWVDPTNWGGSASSDSVVESDVANIPARPSGVPDADANVQVAKSLAADRDNANYDAQQLRGGQDSAAPPPPDAPTEREMPSVAAAAPAETAQTGEPAAPEPTPSAATQAETAPATPAQQAAPADMAGTQAPISSSGAVGFAPSSAPPLDPSLSRFVPHTVLTDYNRTAKLRPPVTPAYGASAQTPTGLASAVVLFAGGTTVLDDAGRQQVRLAVEQFTSKGSKGFIRVIGFAANEAGNVTSARAAQQNFDRAQARASAVGKALIAEGIPAPKVLIETSSQSADRARAEIFVQG